MKHAHISKNITHNYRHNELDCQGIIALYIKINENSNIQQMKQSYDNKNNNKRNVTSSHSFIIYTSNGL